MRASTMPNAAIDHIACRTVLHDHQDSVLKIADRISRFHSQKIPFRIYHGGTNSTRSTTFSDDTSVDTSMLTNIISVNSQSSTCLVESNVSMDALVAATLPFGLMPPVVPEFPGITVGGAFSGTGGESTSFRHGFFDRCVTWFEIILADGEIVTVSPTNLPNLFYGAAGTFGTLGVITMFEIRLIPAKTHVELTYIPVSSFVEAQEKFTSLTDVSSQVDFVDGIMYSSTSGVICSGQLVDLKQYQDQPHPKIVRFSRRWDEWFYIHAQGVLSKIGKTGSTMKELIPLTEYFFRYDRGAFWAGRFVFQWFGMPFTRLTRFLADWLMSTRILYHGLHASGLGRLFIIQDLCFPESTAGDFVSWLDTEYNIYPLWLCPVKQNERISMNPHVASVSKPGQTSGEQLLNIGVWAPCPTFHDRFVCNRRLEAKVQSLKGMKWLYADSFYSEDEFWTIYNRDWYEALRKEYRALTLPTVYQKVRTKDIAKPEVHVDLNTFWALIAGKITVREFWCMLWFVWPLLGISAVMSAWQGEDYLKREQQSPAARPKSEKFLISPR